MTKERRLNWPPTFQFRRQGFGEIQATRQDKIEIMIDVLSSFPFSSVLLDEQEIFLITPTTH